MWGAEEFAPRPNGRQQRHWGAAVEEESEYESEEEWGASIESPGIHGSTMDDDGETHEAYDVEYEEDEGFMLNGQSEPCWLTPSELIKMPPDDGSMSSEAEHKLAIVPRRQDGH